jgi:hypothetical protein
VELAAKEPGAPSNPAKAVVPPFLLGVAVSSDTAVIDAILQQALRPSVGRQLMCRTLRRVTPMGRLWFYSLQTESGGLSLGQGVSCQSGPRPDVPAEAAPHLDAGLTARARAAPSFGPSWNAKLHHGPPECRARSVPARQLDN